LKARLMATLFRRRLSLTEWEATGSGSATQCSRRGATHDATINSEAT
jgi:hypothetical protein